MKILTKQALAKADAWMRDNARPYDLAKWNRLLHGTSKDAIIAEIEKYQNSDGGLGHGFEPDCTFPMSGAIESAEAIFQAYDYGLDMTHPLYKRIFDYFENTVMDNKKYWEDSPKEAMEYPHAPWWNYAPCTEFSPNPCGVVASALIRCGCERQRALGYKIADDCLSHLVSDKFCGDHDTLNMQALVEALISLNSPLATDEVIASMRRRIFENTCFDTSRYGEYVFSPLEYVTSPASIWYDTLSHGIDAALDYFIDTQTEEGFWMPNFAWGDGTETSRLVTEQWKGYITAKRIKILLAFGRVEK